MVYGGYIETDISCGREMCEQHARGVVQSRDYMCESLWG
jgi:hypothetical protein